MPPSTGSLPLSRQHDRSGIPEPHSYVLRSWASEVNSFNESLMVTPWPSTPTSKDVRLPGATMHRSPSVWRSRS